MKLKLAKPEDSENEITLYLKKYERCDNIYLVAKDNKGYERSLLIFYNDGTVIAPRKAKIGDFKFNEYGELKIVRESE